MIREELPFHFGNMQLFRADDPFIAGTLSEIERVIPGRIVLLYEGMLFVELSSRRLLFKRSVS
jgi:hypothetical protein